MLQPADLDPVLDELGLSPAAAIVRLEGGSSDVFRVQLADGDRLVLKRFAADVLAPRKDAYAAGLVAGLDVPTPRYLLVDESFRRLPFRFALTTYLEGTVATSFAAHPHYMDVFRQLGVLAKTLHTVTLPAFGPFAAGGGPPSYATNGEFVRARADDAFGRFLHYGGDPALTEKLRRIFDAGFDEVVPVSGPAVFAHDDLHPGNIVVLERSGELVVTGLIDFGNALASSAVMDLAKAIFCCEHMAPGCTGAILDGYGAVNHPRPAEALAFYTLLHRLTMWHWLRHIGVLPSADAPSDILDALRLTAAKG